jgi:cellulose synthase (UDP-forming)
MPLVALLLLNVTAIGVGLAVMADPPPTWLSVGWASMHVLILGRMIIAAVSSRTSHQRAPGPATAGTTSRSDGPVPAGADLADDAVPAAPPAAAVPPVTAGRTDRPATALGRVPAFAATATNPLEGER